MPDSFIFYRSFADIIAQIPDAETRLEFYEALVAYGIDGEKANFPYPLNLAYEQMCACISSAQAKHEKRVEAGRKGGKKSKGGGAPKGNSNAGAKTTSKQQATTSKQQANDNKNKNVNENNSYSCYIQEQENNAPTVSAPLNAALPAVQWSTEIDEETGEVRFVKHELGANPTE